MPENDNKVAIITGASRGIGAAIADTDDASFDRHIAVNLKGTFNTLRKARKRDHQMFSLTSPNLTRAQLRHSSARATHSVEVIAAAAIVLFASASTLANAAENPARLAREQHTCAVVLGLDPSGSRYDACLRSLDRSSSEWDYARGISMDRNTCERAGLQPGTPAFAVCVVKAGQPQ